MFWILNNLHEFVKSVSFREVPDFPTSYTEIKVSLQIFLCFIIERMVLNCITYHIYTFLHFQETLSSDFLEISFSKIVLGIIL